MRTQALTKCLPLAAGIVGVIAFALPFCVKGFNPANLIILPFAAAFIVYAVMSA